MANRFYRYFLLLLFMLPLPAQAQKCDVAREAIVNLSNPLSPSYFVWDALYGTEEKSEMFIAGRAGNEGVAVVAGETREKDKITLLLMELDKRGRPLWEKKHDVKGLQKVVRMLPYKDGYMIVGDQKETEKNNIWIGFFDAKGDVYKQTMVRDKALDLYIEDIAETPGGYTLAATVKGSSGAASGGYARIYRLNAEGAVKESRAYVPGLENRIHALAPFGDNKLIAAGYMVGDDGRRAGWLLALDQEAKIIWQQQYPRGAAANFREVMSYVDNYALAFGEAEPAGDGNSAAWLMLFDVASGNIGWQRYYRSDDYHMRGQDMMVHPDNQVSLLINAEKIPGGSEPGYVRVLSLSPRGEVLNSEAYYQGQDAAAFHLFPGRNGERTLAGYAKMAYYEKSPETGEDVLKAVSDNAWVAAGVAAEPYTDPCAQPQP